MKVRSKTYEGVTALILILFVILVGFFGIRYDLHKNRCLNSIAGDYCVFNIGAYSYYDQDGNKFACVLTDRTKSDYFYYSGEERKRCDPLTNVGI